MRTIHAITSWADLAVLIEQIAEEPWIFRGEAADGQALLPTAGRVGTYPGAARRTAYRLEDEQHALELFKKQAAPHVAHRPASDLEWLVIAQLHGMHPRLLDWSESILVAAYFAAEFAGTRGDAVIYAVKGLRAVTPAEEEDPFGIAEAGVYQPPRLSARIAAQRNVFTMHPDPTCPFEPPDLVKWPISGETCARIKLVLDACAINESALFPELDGLARYLGWRYRWGRL